VHEIVKAFKNSRNGLAQALKTERAIRQELALFLVSVPSAFLLSSDAWHRATLIGSILAVISIELLNTCVEKLCDHVTPAIHPEVKTVKDLGSAAVLVAFSAAGIFWLVALLARLGWV
jgi:diacylglycerol kinase (ATP)